MKRYFLRLDEQNNVYVSNLLEVAPDNSIEFYANNFIKPQFDKFPEPTTLIEGATQEEIDQYNKPIVTEEISRMKFKIQIRRSTIYSYDIILTYLQNLAVTELFTQDDKDELIDRLEDAVSFNRYHKDFINLANMLGVSDEVKDEIFIEGNKIQ